MADCSSLDVRWSELTLDQLYAILKLRTDIFFLEQKIDETELDWRDSEPETEHYFISDDDGIAAYLRVLVDAAPEYRDARHLPGRVVVRADRRGEGLAQILMAAVIERHGDKPMMLHAQAYVAPLYARFGFVPYGEVYEEAGIEHLSMYRDAVLSEAPA
jgi:ElaA protein